jgi:hypothetical protein
MIIHKRRLVINEEDKVGGSVLCNNDAEENK